MTGCLHGAAVHYQQQKSNHLVQKELQAHLLAHQQMLAGYTDYVKRHTHALLQLVVSSPQVMRFPTCETVTLFRCWSAVPRGHLVSTLWSMEDGGSEYLNAQYVVHAQVPEGNLHSGCICQAEFNRLGILLRGSMEQSLENGSPMDVSPSPFQGATPFCCRCGPPWTPGGCLPSPTGKAFCVMAHPLMRLWHDGR
jgi:hypothetical protein